MTSSHPSAPADSHRLRPLRPADAPAVLDAYRSAADMARQGTVTTLAQAEVTTDPSPATAGLPWRP